MPGWVASPGLVPNLWRGVFAAAVAGAPADRSGGPVEPVPADDLADVAEGEAAAAVLEGDGAQKLLAYARFNSSLPDTLREMAIIMTAAYWTSEFEWNAHKNAALAVGLDPAIVAAIAAGERPAEMQVSEAAIYDLVRQLLNEHRVSDAVFAAAVDTLGERGVVDVIGTVGYYAMVSMFLNLDEYPLPEGVEPEFD
jgi:4-carboxymuconolactone decarboxylase